MAVWIDWIANEYPPWATYPYIMVERMVTLDKYPGVRPVGIL